MTQVSPACALRIFARAVGLATPSHGSTPRATRSSKLNSPGSVLSNQMATRPVYAEPYFYDLAGSWVSRRPDANRGSSVLDLLGCPRRRVARRERFLGLLGHAVALSRLVPAAVRFVARSTHAG